MQRKDVPKVAELLGKAVERCLPAQPGAMSDTAPQTPCCCCLAHLGPFPSRKPEVTVDTVAD